MEPVQVEHKFEVYVYDTELIKDEFEDPLNAVIFHYPSALSNEHVLITAGQLAGVVKFLQVTFGEEATCFELEKGAFEVEHSGRFLLFVGEVGGKSMDDSKSASTLKSLIIKTIGFYFGSLQEWHSSHVECYRRRERKENFRDAVTEFLTAFLDSHLILIPWPRVIPRHVRDTIETKCQRFVKDCSKVVELLAMTLTLADLEEPLFSTVTKESNRILSLCRVAKSVLPSLEVSDFETQPHDVLLLQLPADIVLGHDAHETASDGQSSTSLSNSTESMSEISHRRRIGQAKQQRRRSKSLRNSKMASKKKLQSREVQDTVFKLQRSLYRLILSNDVKSSEAKTTDDNDPQKRTLYLQRIHNLDICLVCAQEFDRATLQFMWNLVLTNLGSFAYSLY